MRLKYLLILVAAVVCCVYAESSILAQGEKAGDAAVATEPQAAASETVQAETAIEAVQAVGAMATPMPPELHSPNANSRGISRATVLVGSLTVFALAVFVGFEVIAKVPPTLHTPLMSGSNAISGVTVVGAIIAAGNGSGGFACFLALIATALATINVVGGFVVTHRMLLMFKKR